MFPVLVAAGLAYGAAAVEMREIKKTASREAIHHTDDQYGLPLVSRRRAEAMYSVPPQLPTKRSMSCPHQWRHMPIDMHPSEKSIRQVEYLRYDASRNIVADPWEHRGVMVPHGDAFFVGRNGRTPYHESPVTPHEERVDGAVQGLPIGSMRGRTAPHESFRMLVNGHGSF